jgi:hypothetical protein
MTRIVTTHNRYKPAAEAEGGAADRSEAHRYEEAQAASAG